METVHDNRAGSTLDAQGALSGLDAIAAEEAAEQNDAQQQAAQQQAAQQQSEIETLAGEWRQAIEAAKDLIVSTFPAAIPVWTAGRMDNLSAALARCDQVYGWGGVGSLFGHPLVGLAVAGFPLAVGTVRVVKDEAEKAKRIKAGETATTVPAHDVPADPTQLDAVMAGA